MGLFKRKCGYSSASPFRVKCIYLGRALLEAIRA
jgi:hypothetical protein